MQRETLIGNIQAVVYLFVLGGYGYSLYHFLSFYGESNEITGFAIAVSAFLFILPWALIGVVLAFAVNVAVTSIAGIIVTAQTLFRH